MDNKSLLVLGIVNLIAGLFIIFFECINIYKKKKLKLISFVRLFYGLIYGISPYSIYSHVYRFGANTSSLQDIDFSNEGIDILWFGTLLSLLGYLFLNIGYLNFKKNIFSKRSKMKRKKIYNYSTLETSARLLVTVGAISLLIWTSAFGGPIAILPYANALRAGWDTGVYNPYSFFMRLCQFSLFGTYIFWILFLEKRKTKAFIGFIMGSIFSLLYIFANSGRLLLGLFLVVLIYLYNENKMNSKNLKKTNLVVYIFLGIFALILMNSAEPILNIIQGKDSQIVTVKFDLFSILREEFFFPIVSLQNVIRNINQGEVSPRILVEIISSGLAWFPSRFRPDHIIALEKYNTLLIKGTTIYGGIPVDFITYTLYQMGYIGIIILPILFGKIIKHYDAKFSDDIRNSYDTLMFILIGFYMLKAVGYSDPANIMQNIFYVVFGHAMVIFIQYITRRRGIIA